MPTPTKAKQDPTRQAGNRNKAAIAIRKRLRRAQRQVIALFERVPYSIERQTVVVNATVPVYDYEITPEELAALLAAVQSVITDQLLETPVNRMPPQWWFQPFVELPYRQGAAREIVEFNRLITQELVRTRTALGSTTQRLDVAQVLRSPEYVQALDKVYVRNFQGMKSLSDRTATQVAQVIDAGIAAGEPASEIADDIAKRFDVSRSSAERTAVTEVNWAYNDARLDATELAGRMSGLRAGVLHLSALLPGTRETHGERHGNGYTVAAQRQWWNTGANRIRCHCSTRTVLIDAEGRVIDAELQEEIKLEREFFDK